MKLPVIGTIGTKKQKAAPVPPKRKAPYLTTEDLKELERAESRRREAEWEAEINARNAPPTWLGRRRGNWLAPSHRALGRYWNDRLRRLGW